MAEASSTAHLALRAVVLTVFVAYLLMLYRGTPWLADPMTVGSDPSNYFASGQRLNDHHDLYRLGPGDLAVPVLPPYYTVPLVSPPPIAVVWRPIALMPRDIAIRAWWGAAMLALVTTTVWFTGLGSIVVLLAVLALSTELAFTALSANLNAELVGVFALIWLADRARRPALVGTLVALAVAVKVLPIVFVVWLIVGRRWRSLGWFAGAATGIAAVSLVGAGIGAHVDWLSVARDTGTAGLTPASLGGAFEALGASPAVASMALPLTLLIGCTVIVLLRDRPNIGFAVAIVTIVLANPAVHDGSFALLLPALLPWARRASVPGPAIGQVRRALTGSIATT